MKSDIHPTYNQVQATCVCGNVILTGSTRAVIKMDICSACHPFFTGTQKIVDTEGRVEKFKKRYQAAAPKKAAKAEAEQPTVEETTAPAPEEAATAAE
jgi:large subunit ribosomal protein L31